MRPRSAKREAEYRARRPLVARLLTERPWCEACPLWAHHDGKVTYVRQPAVDVHEVLTRGRGGSILDEANCMTVCRACHRRIDAHPLIAEELGLVRHSWDD